MNTISWQPGVTLAMVEREIILKAYNYFDNNKTRTAESLGIAVRTLDAKLAQYEEQQNETSKEGKEGHSLQTESKHGMESTSEVSTESSVPVHERQEVQKVPSSSRSGNRSKRVSA